MIILLSKKKTFVSRACNVLSRSITSWCSPTRTTPELFDISSINFNNDLLKKWPTIQCASLIPLLGESSASLDNKLIPSKQNIPVRYLSLDERIKSGLTYLGVKHLNSVQLNSFVPLYFMDRDLLIRAPCGSGKTFAFLVPIFSRILEDGKLAKSFNENDITFGNHRRQGIDTIILCPTRELAQQTLRVASQLALNAAPHIRVSCVSGGFKIEEELDSLQRDRPQILIATPGRLIDHLRHTNAFQELTSSVRALIVDEAAWFVRCGAFKNVIYIKNRLPNDVNTAFVSATVGEETSRVLRRHLKTNFQYLDVAGFGYFDGEIQDAMSRLRLQSGQPVALTHDDTVHQNLMPPPSILESADMKPYATPQSSGLRHFVHTYKAKHFLMTLWNALRIEVERAQDRGGKIIVFFPSLNILMFTFTLFKHVLPSVFHFATKNSLDQQPTQNSPSPQFFFSALHKKLSPERRRRTFESFQNSSHAILFSSDLVAQGVDASSVQTVIMVGSSEDSQIYVHRAGRSARGGQVGRSLLLLCEELELHWLEILKKEQGLDLTEIPHSWKNSLKCPFPDEVRQALGLSPHAHDVDKYDEKEKIEDSQHSWSKRRQKSWLRNKENAAADLEAFEEMQSASNIGVFSSSMVENQSIIDIQKSLDLQNDNNNNTSPPSEDKVVQSRRRRKFLNNLNQTNNSVVTHSNPSHHRNQSFLDVNTNRKTAVEEEEEEESKFINRRQRRLQNQIEKSNGGNRRLIEGFFDGVGGSNELKTAARVGGMLHLDRIVERALEEDKNPEDELRKWISRDGLNFDSATGTYHPSASAEFWFDAPSSYASCTLAYRSWLGFYSQKVNTLRLDKNIIPAAVNDFLKSMGLFNPPRVTVGFAKELGLWDAVADPKSNSMSSNKPTSSKTIVPAHRQHNGLRVSHFAPQLTDLLACLPSRAGWRSLANERSSLTVSKMGKDDLK